MNPLLPNHYYIPDVEARLWDDGRLYLYGSMDICRNTLYCSNRYHVFSSANMVDWVDHGESFHISKSHPTESDRLFAPDCFYKDDTYYLLYCGFAGMEGIASSKTPYGPFGQGRAVIGADRDGIDPCALVDDDGKVYYFWGQFTLRGACLNSDLTAIDYATFCPNLLCEKDDGFHEGASIRKRNGIYYLVYTDTSRGKATSLAYATSTQPLGPYTKRGIIIDNDHCDSKTWNNHGSIAEFNGQWYVFYHRSSQGGNWNRRVCVEPIFFSDDGLIAEVAMTTQGNHPPLAATTAIEAYRACLLGGNIRTEPILTASEHPDFSECLTNVEAGSWAAYKYLCFTKGLTHFCATVASMTGGGMIEVRADDCNGALIAECTIPNTGSWRRWQRVSAELKLPIEGVHALYLVFRGGRGQLCDVLDFCFQP
jgi:hypothetical protein